MGKIFAIVKKVAAAFFAFIFLFLSISLVFAQGQVTRETKIVRVGADEIIEKDFYISAGDVVEISGTVNGDVVIAGGQLLIDGVVNGDLLAVGGTVNLSGEVTQDARIVGGQLNVTGKIGRNLTVVGGNIDIGKTAEIGGGLLGGGGKINISAPINGDVVVGAGTLTIGSVINGNLEVGVGSLRLTENAVIDGDLTYYSDTEATIDKTATVSGKIVQKVPPEGTILSKDFDFGAFGKGISLGARIVSLLAALLFGLLMLRFYPNYTKRVATTAKLKFWKALGVGFLTLIIAPITAITLFITIIGFPIGVIIIFSYLVYLYTAKIFVAYWAGDFIYKKLGKRENVYWIYVVGIVAYYLVSLIPFIGGLTSFVVLLVGLGAVVIDYRITYELAKKSKVI